MTFRAVMTLLALFVAGGCSIIGPLVPPDTIGVRAKQERADRGRTSTEAELMFQEREISSRPPGDTLIRPR